MSVEQRMHPDDVRELAKLIAADLRDEMAAPGPALVDTHTLADALGVSADFVRTHAVELGGFRIGDSPRAPWRFSVDEARQRMTARGSSKQSEGAESPGRAKAPRTARRRPRASTGQILAIRGAGA